MKRFLSFVAALGALAAVNVYAQEAEEADPDAELRGEIAYVEALIEYGYSDFAVPVIAATKAKWPQSEAPLFAIEVRGLLSLNKFDEAEAKIAALPDRNGAKYWAARLEVANNYANRSKKAECAKIYEEFFTKYPTPPKELREFHLQASYMWGQILVMDKRIRDAVKIYQGMLDQINIKRCSNDERCTWCNVACETAEMYLRLAAEIEDVKKRQEFLQPAKKLIDTLLWQQDLIVFFGRAIAMKAHWELLNGNVTKAQAVIDDYMDQLAAIHKSILEYDPEGRNGLLRQSPMPQCRYLLARMLWDEVQDELKKAKPDDERIKALMFGAKVDGRRNGSGAFNHAVNVFVQFPESGWAAAAGELSEKIRAFAEKRYSAHIQTDITPEQIARVRAMQFKSANEKLAEGDYAGAITDYLDALSRAPEGMEGIRAVENLISCYLNLLARVKDATEEKKFDWRIDADAIEGYLAERFAGLSDRSLMTAAGDAVIRVAASEKQWGNLARSDALYKSFFVNYRRHVNAPPMATAMGVELQKQGRYEDAIAIWRLFEKYYTTSPFYSTALSSLATCLEKCGDRKGAIEALNRYCDNEKTMLRKIQGQMSLASLYQKDGLEMLENAQTNEVEEARIKQEKLGSAQIIRGIKQFRDFAEKCDRQLADPSVPKGEKKQYAELKGTSLYFIADCWRRLNRPEAKIDDFRRNSAAVFEEYLRCYPEGRFSTNAYVRLATIYTALGDGEKSKNALDRLAQAFPESREAKNSKPQLAKALIEMGKIKEGTELYGEMLRTDGSYTAGQFIAAGEALINAKSWDLANQAFERAIAKAGTNQLTTVARGRIGQAKALFRQKSYAEAREAIDLFLGDEKMSKLAIAADAYLLMVEVAKEQGRTEKDDVQRGRYFGAAVGAIKKLRNYWKSKPQWEQDRIDLMSAEVVIGRVEAEEKMGLKAQALDSAAKAAATLQGFWQSHHIDENHPADKMSAQELANLQTCYEKMVPLYAKLGGERAEFVLKYGEEYLELFPNGRQRTLIQNCINQAKAGGAKLQEKVEAPQEAAAAAPEESSDESESEEKTEPAAEDAAEEQSETESAAAIETADETETAAATEDEGENEDEE